MKRKRNSILTGLAIGVFLSISGVASAADIDYMPRFSLDKMDRKTIGNKALKGKVTVINLWATWCEACKTEIKEFETAFTPLSFDKSFQIMFVSVDKNPEDAKKWMNENLKNTKWGLSSLYSDKDMKFANQLDPSSFPVTYVVSPTGKILYQQNGFEAGKGHTEKLLKIVKKELAAQ